ncbi:hypothetical protein BC943DRAFT_132218 [Umbelopsis sp. AD052]|nr:hypothetical protein BC943DRAFT_132218 [Umbelopsis sp. AD052]
MSIHPSGSNMKKSLVAKNLAPTQSSKDRMIAIARFSNEIVSDGFDDCAYGAALEVVLSSSFIPISGKFSN